jgi:hypothetical protein
LSSPIEARGLRIEFTPNYIRIDGWFEFFGSGCFYTIMFDFEYKKLNPRTMTQFAMMDIPNAVITMADGLENYHH